MGVVADSLRELVSAMKENEERQRKLLEEDLNDIIQGLDRVSAGLQAITDEFETLEPLDEE